MVVPLPPGSRGFGLKPTYGFLFAPTFALLETFALGRGGSARGDGDGVGILAFFSGDVGREVLDGEDGRDGGPNVFRA